jgi:hypothetical protein
MLYIIAAEHRRRRSAKLDLLPGGVGMAAGKGNASYA